MSSFAEQYAAFQQTGYDPEQDEINPPPSVDWQVVDDLVADGWPEDDARRFATARPQSERPA